MSSGKYPLVNTIEVLFVARLWDKITRGGITVREREENTLKAIGAFGLAKIDLVTDSNGYVHRRYRADEIGPPTVAQRSGKWTKPPIGKKFFLGQLRYQRRMNPCNRLGDLRRMP